MLLGVAAVVSASGVGWLALTYPDFLLPIGKGTAWLGYALVVLCFTPAGFVRLGNPQAALPYSQWLGKILAFQGVGIILTLSVFVAFFYQGPPFLETFSLSSESLYDLLKKYIRSDWGIFPWSLYALWGIVLSYIVYSKNGLPYLYQCVQGFCPKILQPLIKGVSLSAYCLATFMMFTLVVCAIILLFSHALENYLQCNHFRVASVMIIIFTCIMPIFGTKLFKKYCLRGKFGLKNYNSLYAFAIVFLFVLLAIGAWGNQWMIERFAQLWALKCTRCEHYLGSAPLEVRYAAFFWSWFLLCVPLGGSYIARISLGRSMREIILGIFLVPFILVLLGALFGKMPFIALMDWAVSLPRIPALIALGGLTWGIFYKVLKGQKGLDFEFSGYLCPPDKMSRNRLWLRDGPKAELIAKQGSKIMLAVIGTLSFHTMMGWVGVQVEILGIAIMIINTCYVTLIAVAIQFYKDKIWQGNNRPGPYFF